MRLVWVQHTGLCFIEDSPPKPGILESLNITVDDNYPWEIAFDEPEGGSSADMKETPQILDVAASFKPILNQLPRLDQRILSTYTSTLP